MPERVLPKAVEDASMYIGGYLGLEDAFFTLDGKPTDTQPDEGCYMVVGNYYGAAVYLITKDAIERVK